jgi:16S rRNA (guanine527-N7)-methyltransferase
MDTARIAVLLQPFLEQPLPPSMLDQISIYIDLLQRWNARINLTAIRQEEEIVTRHFGESFFLASHLFPASSQICHPDPELAEGEGPASCRAPMPGVRIIAPFAMSGNPPRVLDIGSGAGFPGLPLKLWAPQIHLTLIESNHKKATFLREAARALTLTDIYIIADRAETVAARPHPPQAEVVTLRAVEGFAAILPQALSFLSPSGTLALLIGASQLPHLNTTTTLKWRPPINVPKSHSRVLSIGVRA